MVQIYAETECRAKVFASPIWRYKNEVTDARSLCGANLFAAVQALSRCMSAVRHAYISE